MFDLFKLTYRRAARVKHPMYHNPPLYDRYKKVTAYTASNSQFFVRILNQQMPNPATTGETISQNNSKKTYEAIPFSYRGNKLSSYWGVPRGYRTRTKTYLPEEGLLRGPWGHRSTARGGFFHCIPIIPNMATRGTPNWMHG